MTKAGSILAVIEPEVHPGVVVNRAAWLAGLTGCDLHLLFCDHDIGRLRESLFLSNEARDIGHRIMDTQRALVDELAETARTKGVTTTTEVLEERPIADGVLQTALNIEPAYVVKGTQYHSTAERSIFIDTDWQLIRSCPFPLWLAKPGEFRTKPLLVASVDPTHSHDKPAALDQVIVDAAMDIVAKTDGELHLLHTYQRLSEIGAVAIRTFKPIELPIDELEQKIQDEHREKLQALAAANDIDAEHIHQLPGYTREILPTFVRAKKADLVVMGALARWGLKRAIVGSTAERVLDHLPCDILIVRGETSE